MSVIYTLPMAPRVRVGVSGAPCFNAAAFPACPHLSGLDGAWWHWLGLFFRPSVVVLMCTCVFAEAVPPRRLCPGFYKVLLSLNYV